jgi:hypothetical protein
MTVAVEHGAARMPLRSITQGAGTCHSDERGRKSCTRNGPWDRSRANHLICYVPAASAFASPGGTLISAKKAFGYT